MAVKQIDRERSRIKRKMRIRKKVYGTPERPRLTIFRSDKHIYAQVVDDTRGITVAATSTLSPDFKEHEKPKGKVESAKLIGQLIARKAQATGVSKVVFDRNGFMYHGRIKALADSAREAGLDF